MSVLLAIVISIAIAHLLTGIARLIWDGVTRFSFPLVHWIAFSLFLCIDFWFYVWSLRDNESWSFAYVSFLVFQAALIYLLSHLIVPRESEKTPVDMTAFYEARRRKYMAICVITAASNEALNLTLPGFGDLHLALGAERARDRQHRGHHALRDHLRGGAVDGGAGQRSREARCATLPRAIASPPCALS